MTLAHARIMSGHRGVHRTQERVVTSFWWSGMSNDITHFCDVCQRTFSKGHVSKVPLGTMPIIDTPFKSSHRYRFPASSRGYRYILTLVNFATRYAKAVPLKSITTTSVAEALVGFFCACWDSRWDLVRPRNTTNQCKDERGWMLAFFEAVDNDSIPSTVQWTRGAF